MILLAGLAPLAHAEHPAAIDAEHVVLPREGGLDVFDRDDGAFVARLPTTTGFPQALWLRGGRLYETVGSTLFVWEEGRLTVIRHGAKAPDFIDGDGVAWSVQDGLVVSTFVNGGVAYWSLERDPTRLPYLPALAPPVVGFLAVHPDCRPGGHDVALCSEDGATSLVAAADEARISTVPGSVMAAGPAGLIAGDLYSRETYLYDPDGALVYKAPFYTTYAGVGDDAFVLVEDRDVDLVWIVDGDGTARSWPLPPAPEREAWTIAFSKPAVRVEAGNAVAWLAVDDLAVLAAAQLRGDRDYFWTPVPDGVEVRPATYSALRPVTSERWSFVASGTEGWQFALAGRPGPLVGLPSGRLQLFFANDGTLRAFDATNGRPRWSVAIPGVEALKQQTIDGDRLLLSGRSGWAFVDLSNGRILATGVRPVRDLDAFPVFTDADGDVRDHDGRVLRRIGAKDRALGVLSDGGFVTAEDGAVVVRDGDTIRWWQVPRPGRQHIAAARVVGDSIWLTDGAIVRLDGRTGEVTAAVPWALGNIRRLR